MKLIPSTVDARLAELPMSSKVAVPAAVEAVVASVFMVLAALGVELPAGINEAVTLEAIAAVLYLVTLVQTIVGYVTAERSPAPSARKALEAKNFLVTDHRPDRRQRRA